MSRVRSGGIILLLAVPFALYVAWQLQAASRIDLIVSSPPADKASPTQEQLAADKAKAERWAADVRTMESVAFQFRQPGSTDAVADEESKTLLKSIAARSAEMTNLEKFLSDVDSPDYIPTRLSQKYEDWHKSKQKLAEAARHVETWLANPLDGVDGSRAAADAFERFQKLLEAYTEDTRFADPTKAAGWGLQARIKVIQALDAVAKEPYKKVSIMPLPLPSEDASEDVKKALGAPRAIAEQARALQDEQEKAKGSGMKLSDRILGEAEKALLTAGTWSARERLLGLFAEPTLFAKADGAADWLRKVQDVYDKTNLAEDRTRLRDKVQEFCEAFLPAKVLLDDQVLWKGKPYGRGDIKIKVPDPNKGGAVGDEPPLSRDPDGYSEFITEKKYEGVTGAAIYCKGEPGVFLDLRPTPLSLAAKGYLAARASVLSGSGSFKWSPNSIEALKNKCNSSAEDVNQLKTPDGKAVPARIWDRLQNLADGARMCPALFANRE